MLLFLNVFYLRLAIAMVALILMQRGAGAQAGSGFGGGASGTVFGARGASNFLTKSTKWLAIAFFSISLFMAWQATRKADDGAQTAQDLGVMSQVPVAPVTVPGSTQAVPTVPRAPAPTSTNVPPAPVTQTAVPAPTTSPVPVESKQPAPQPPPAGG